MSRELKKTLYVFGDGIGVKEGALRPTPNTYKVFSVGLGHLSTDDLFCQECSDVDEKNATSP